MSSDTRSRRTRRRRRAQRTAERPNPPAARRRTPAKDPGDIPKWLGVALITAWIGVFMTIHHTVFGYVDLIRWMSGGNEAVMAIAGWLLFFAPFGLGWALILFHRRLSTLWKQVLGAAAVFLIPVPLALFPTSENWTLVEAADGAGGAAFIAGVLNGSLAAVVPCAVVPFIALNSRLRDTFGDRLLRNALIPPVSAFLVATLVAAIIFGQS